ncbi:Set1/Ash2 histone methyltransferase complex subunit ASH2 [Kappamyces sp. JEL0829]|nr:Set1/Ash2 histone methyltransferase complex subunit ASH2 [Kappamyces sp. JEL0829]
MTVELSDSQPMAAIKNEPELAGETKGAEHGQSRTDAAGSDQDRGPREGGAEPANAVSVDWKPCWCTTGGPAGTPADVPSATDTHKKPDIPCMGPCGRAFHQDCLPPLKGWSYPLLLADSYYALLCAECNSESPGVWDLKRLALTWLDVVTLALLNLSWTCPLFTLDDEDNKFYHKKEIMAWIEANWSKLWVRPITVPWAGCVTACLAASTARFASLDEGLYAICTLQALSDFVAAGEKSLIWKRPVAALLLSDGTLVEVQGEQDKARGKRRLETLGYDNLVEDIFEGVSEGDALAHVAARSSGGLGHRKKKRLAAGFKFDEEYVDPATAISTTGDLTLDLVVYPDLDNVNDDPVVISKQPTHTAPQVVVFSDGLTVTNEKGYRMAKASHGAWEGHWYFEVTLNNSQGNARIGWSQISGDLQAPCGYDIFSYSFRNAPGTLFYNSKSVKNCPEVYEAGYKKGDVLGVAIYLPKKKRGQRECAVDVELLRRLWDPSRMDQYMPFKSKPFSTLPKSYIEFFKNGYSLGQAFTNLNMGKYHPAISLFNGASATVNFGPDFIFPPLDAAQPFCRIRDVPTWEEAMYNHKLIVDEQAALKRAKELEKKRLKEGEGKTGEADPEPGSRVSECSETAEPGPAPTATEPAA